MFAGNRAEEYAQRLRGTSYEDIARRGGGILSTVRAVRQSSETQLFDESAPRLKALLAAGVHLESGALKEGYAADFVVWDVRSLDELGYWVGFNPCRTVVKAAEVVKGQTVCGVAAR